VPDGGSLVQPQPARRIVLACMRVAAQLRFEQCRVGAEAARRQVARWARRALGLRVRDRLLFQGQLRGGGVPRDAGTRVDAASVRLAARPSRASAAQSSTALPRV
jgi:hypothetical protein